MADKHLYIISDINHDLSFNEGGYESIIIKFQDIENENKHYLIEIDNSFTNEMHHLLKMYSVKSHTIDQIKSVFKHLVRSESVCTCPLT